MNDHLIVNDIDDKAKTAKKVSRVTRIRHIKKAAMNDEIKERNKYAKSAKAPGLARLVEAYYKIEGGEEEKVVNPVDNKSLPKPEAVGEKSAQENIVESATNAFKGSREEGRDENKLRKEYIAKIKKIESFFREHNMRAFRILCQLESVKFQPPCPAVLQNVLPAGRA